MLRLFLSESEIELLLPLMQSFFLGFFIEIFLPENLNIFGVETISSEIGVAEQQNKEF